MDVKSFKRNSKISYYKDCDKSCCILCKEPKSHNVIPINQMSLEEEEIKNMKILLKIWKK